MDITNHIHKECCGCGACVSRCPKHALSMQSDKEGFLYPSLDKSACVECGICENVCPVLKSDNAPRMPLQSFAAISDNEKIRLKSSSGGIFSELAKTVIKDGGIVFGAKFDADWKVIHDYTETEEGIAEFRGSKYVQSEIGESYIKAEGFLKQGRKVLFTGTPCQIAGLKSFLKKDYDSLLAVEVICHGTPSPRIWKDYVDSVQKNGQISSIVFRDKSTGWRKYSVSFNSDEGTMKSTVYHADPYMKAFLGNYSLRPSCYVCKQKSGKSGADICLGDLWGVKDCSLDDNCGTSALMVYTDKGMAHIYDSSIKTELIDYLSIAYGNPSLENCSHKPILRQLFWKEYKKEGISAIYSVELRSRNLFVRGLRKVKSLYKQL